jgi:acyl-CoA reductase-like NAD-dependent aldehyde dehydrogenase
VETLRDLRSGQAVAVVSQATPGMISRDLLSLAEARQALEAFSSRELVAICERAAAFFADGDLPLGDSLQGPELQSPEDYVRQLSATTGMPRSLVRSNREKIVKVLANMEAMLGGLTRGLPLEVLDRGWGEEAGRRLSYARQTEALGAVLPNNSPGVHTLWLPAIPLKVPLVLRPGSAEPWTPYRVIQAFLAAGAPPQAFSFYPSDHAGGTEILLRCDRSMIFGDQSTVERWSRDVRVQAHGPGWSKIFLGPDEAESWPQHLELMAESASSNGGRSCINASGIWVTAHGRQLAEALAERLGALEARGLEDPEARLAAFSNPAVARGISELIDSQLAQGGAEDLSARHRQGSRVVEVDGCTFLLPTVIWCEDPSHPLAQAEFGFPFVTVVEVPAAETFHRCGPTLVATVLSEDAEFRAQALACPHVDRLNFGAIPTHHLAWDQPHEGNLFEFLYRQRAFQAA